MEEIQKPRSIAKVGTSTKDVLNLKVQDYKDNGVPMNVISDYIYKGINEIDLKIEQLNNYKDMIDKEIQGLSAHKDTVKIECAEWFTENGFDKLEGIEVSSITLTKPKAETSKIVTNKTFKCSLSKEEIQDILVGQNLASYETSTSTKITPFVPSKIKINLKRK